MHRQIFVGSRSSRVSVLSVAQPIYKPGVQVKKKEYPPRQDFGRVFIKACSFSYMK